MIVLTALRRILGAYNGQLLEHAPYEWVDIGLREKKKKTMCGEWWTPRQQLSTKCSSNAVTSMLPSKRPRGRSQLTETPEELYRRVMVLQNWTGVAPIAAKRTLRELEARLSEIDAEPAEETVRLLGR